MGGEVRRCRVRRGRTVLGPAFPPLHGDVDVSAPRLRDGHFVAAPLALVEEGPRVIVSGLVSPNHPVGSLQLVSALVAGRQPLHIRGFRLDSKRSRPSQRATCKPLWARRLCGNVSALTSFESPGSCGRGRTESPRQRLTGSRRLRSLPTGPARPRACSVAG